MVLFSSNLEWLVDDGEEREDEFPDDDGGGGASAAAGGRGRSNHSGRMRQQRY